MPWILHEPNTPRARLRRRLRHWRYDHGQALLSLAIGAACSAGTVGLLKVAGVLG